MEFLWDRLYGIFDPHVRHILFWQYNIDNNKKRCDSEANQIDVLEVHKMLETG